MPYSIRLLSHQNLIEICCTGSMTLEEAESARRDALNILTQQNLRCILADTRQAKVRLSTMELYRFSASHGETLPVGTRIAVLYEGKALNPEDARFIENVSVTRGTSFRVFTELNDALTWLSRQEPASVGWSRVKHECPACGRRYRADTLFCNKCGIYLPTSKPSRPDSPPKED